jgi:PPP family 3-phenylpropionic acid transporter
MNNIIRAYYFLFHVGVGCVMSFLPTYLKTEGFSGTEISSIISLGSLCGLLGFPIIWGSISDRLQKPQLILKILAFGIFVGSIPLLVLKSYWPIFGTYLIYSICSIGVMGILDSVASLRAKEKGIDFGKLRLFAPAGWLFGAVGLGYFIDLTGRTWNDPSVIVAIVISFGAMFLISLGMGKSKTEHTEKPTFDEIKALFKNKFLVLFYIMATINIVGICAYWVYYGPLIESKGLTPKIVGLSIGVGTLSEVILIFFFEKLRKWLGLELLIILSILVSMGRWQVIAHTSNPYILVGIQVFHSEIGLFTMACITFVTDHVSRKLVTTAQTIFYTLTYGIGQYFGIMLMGYLFDYYKDSSKLFAISSYIHILPLMMISYIWLIKRKTQPEIQSLGQHNKI